MEDSPSSNCADAQQLQSALRTAYLQARPLSSCTPLALPGPISEKTNNTTVKIWVGRAHIKGVSSVEEVAQACADIKASSDTAGGTCAWIFQVPPEDRVATAGEFVVVLETGTAPEINDRGHHDHQAFWLPRFFGSKYQRLLATGDDSEDDLVITKPTSAFYSRLALGFLSLAFIMAAILLIGLAAMTSQAADNKWPDSGYVRYPTPGSDGPKRQLRILYHNATEWSRNNPHDDGQWKIRIDDQALIPIEAWDEDEDRYQQWFYDRYKVMASVVDTRMYIRPSWLGSLNVSVPWDDEFHLAHCVLTMRRYWKAKETGRHVCPRDIVPPHIQHCLNYLESVVFTPNPKIPAMGPSMAWQTKVCF